MTGPEKFALLNARLEYLNAKHPFAFDLITLGLGLVFGGIVVGGLMLLDRIGR